MAEGRRIRWYRDKAGRHALPCPNCHHTKCGLDCVCDCDVHFDADEADAKLQQRDRRIAELESDVDAARTAVGEAWLGEGTTLADAIRAKTERLEELAVETGISRRSDAIFAAAFVREFYDAARFDGPPVDPESIARFAEEAETLAELWREHAKKGEG